MEGRYVPLRCKSNYSFLEGASHPEELVSACRDLGLPAFALTDRDGVYGAVRAHLEAGRLGVHLIVGSELSIDGGRSIVLLAEDHGGYRNLCKLISTGRLRSEKGSSLVHLDELAAHAQGLSALWVDPGPAGGAGDRDLAGALAPLEAAYRGHLAIGIARHRRAEEVEEERRLRSAARRYGLPLVAAPEVLYHHPARKSMQDVLTCIRKGVTLDAAGRLLRPNAEYSLRPPEELFGLYADEPELLMRTLEIAERCTFSLAMLEYRYPVERVPEGYTTGEWLWKITFEGARSRYRTGQGGKIPPEVAAQLEKELVLIEELGYSGYFLTMWEIVEYCRSKEILCQGRGSAANSAVCFCLGITAIDPVRMDLLFERFLSKERAEPPDIDLDIEHRRREEVIQHMYEKYGRDRAAMVANVIRYRSKSAVRDVGKALGISSVALDRCAKSITRWDSDVEGVLRTAGLDPELRTTRLLVEMVKTIRDFPRHLSIHPGGFLLGSEPVDQIVPIENATMPGRTVIQWDKYDVEAMNLFKVDLLGLGALTHLDYCFRLLKSRYRVEMGLASVPPEDPGVFAMVRRADTVGVFQIESRAQMAMLPRLKPEHFYDLVIQISIIRPGPITGGMVHPYLRRRAGEEAVVYPHPSLEPVLRKTLGIPLFQEQVMKLAVIAGSYTPGEADQLRRDMAAWRSSGKIEGHREKLISRMIANGIAPEFAERVFDQIRGFGEYGFPESHAASFAVIAYATAWMKHHYPDVFTCALLNAWPMGFYLPSTIVDDAKRHGVRVLPIDLLSSEWECTLEVTERPVTRPDGRVVAGPPARALTRPPARTQRDRPPGTRPDGGAARYAVRMGLRYVKGLGEEDYRRIASARSALGLDRRRSGRTAASRPRSKVSGAEVSPAGRQGTGPAGGTVPEDERSSEELIERFAAVSRLPRDALIGLAEAGAFRGFGRYRRDVLWRLLGSIGEGARGRGTRGAGPNVAGEAVEGLGALDAEMPVVFERLDAFQVIGWDYEASGHSTFGHPVEPYREQLRGRGFPEAAGLSVFPDGEEISYVGLVICRQMPDNAAGVLFVTMEDETGFVNLIVWPKAFERYRSTILSTSFLGVTGKIQLGDGVVHLIADRFWLPDLETKPATVRSRDFH